MSVELKVKAKSLAAEARIIRKEENKALANGRWLRSRTKSNYPHQPAYDRYNSLRDHRTGPVRIEARNTHLARAFLKGTPYKSVEQPVRKSAQPYAKYIASMAARYSDMSEGDAFKSVLAWMDKK